MAKITFKKDSDGKILINREIESKIIQKDDWDLALEIARESRNNETTAISIIMKNRPHNIVYGVFCDRLVPGVIMREDDDIRIVFDDGKKEGTSMLCEDGDVAYTDLIEAIGETDKTLSTAETNDEAPKDVASALKHLFSNLASSIDEQKKKVDEMSDEQKEIETKKAIVLMRKLKLISRRQQLLEMISEIDSEIQLSDTIISQMNGEGDDEDE